MTPEEARAVVDKAQPIFKDAASFARYLNALKDGILTGTRQQDDPARFTTCDHSLQWCVCTECECRCAACCSETCDCCGGERK